MVASLLLAAALAAAPGSDDAAVVNPDKVKVLLENDQVRVLEYTLRPGEHDQWHTQPAGAWYVVGGGTLRIHTADGGSRDSDERTGAATWRDALPRHYLENVGPSPVRIVITEVKSAPAPGAAAPKTETRMQEQLDDLGMRYAAAWSSQDPARLAAFYAENGSLTVNAGAPSVGRAAIAATARSFMAAFPDMIVTMTQMTREGEHVVFHWLWTGTNTGPGGTGKAVRLIGTEEWTLDASGLIVESKGRYNEVEYKRQLSAGAARKGT